MRKLPMMSSTWHGTIQVGVVLMTLMLSQATGGDDLPGDAKRALERMVVNTRPQLDSFRPCIFSGACGTFTSLSNCFRLVCAK